MAYFSLPQTLSLARSLVTKTSPTYVQFYITARCNLACEQCNIIYADAAAAEMTIDQIRRVADNMAAIGVCIVLLIGGEPFVRRDLPDIVKAFTDVGLHVRLQTNGMATRQALEACVRNGAHDISVSLDTLRPSVQDTINGAFRGSWAAAIDTVATINDIFPPNGTAFFGTVLMPRNVEDAPSVVEFASRIGWGVSLVPVHTTSPDRPRAFRTFDPSRVVTFGPADYPAVAATLGRLKAMRREGFNVYDSDEYLDDVYRFVTGQPLRWRQRNGGVCDSPHLYFAVAPNGHLKVCVDYDLESRYPVYDEAFPGWFADRRIHQEAYAITRACDGCMYGSYPEITISARFLGPMVRRFRYFTLTPPRLARLSAQEMRALALEIQGRRPAARDLGSPA